MLSNLAQHRVYHPGRAGGETVARQVNHRVYRGVVFHPHLENLMNPHPQHREQLRI